MKHPCAWESILVQTILTRFRSGDEPVLAAAKQSIRQGFRDKAGLLPNDPSIAPAIQHAEEVASFLKANIVQGKKEGDVYKLRIHEHTERGDNESIKQAGRKKTDLSGVKCCSAR